MPQELTDFTQFSKLAREAGSIPAPKPSTLWEDIEAEAAAQTEAERPRTLWEEIEAEAAAPTAGERVQGIGANLLRGAGSVASGVFLETPRILGRQIAKAIIPDDLEGGMQPEEEATLSKLADGARRGMASLVPESVEQEGPGVGRFLTSTLPQAIGSTGGFVASGGATGLMGAAVAGAASNGAAAWHEARMSGASEETAWTAYLLNGGLGTLEAAGIGKVLARFTGGAQGGAIRSALLSGSEEGITEGIQQVGGNLIASQTYDADRKALEGIVEAGGAGFLSAALLSVLGSAAGARRQRGESTPTERIVDAQSTLLTGEPVRDLTGAAPPENAADVALMEGVRTDVPNVETSAPNEPAQASIEEPAPQPLDTQAVFDRVAKGEKVKPAELHAAVQEEIRLAKEDGVTLDATSNEQDAFSRINRGEKVSDEDFAAEVQRELEANRFAASAGVAEKRVMAERAAGKQAVQAERAKQGDFPVAGPAVDGRKVRGEVPNLSSIEATLEEGFEIQKGIRDVPLSAIPGSKAGELFHAAGDVARTERLADEIKKSGEIAPIIIAVGKDGPRIVEGAHRVAALNLLGAKSFPALVVHEAGIVKRAEGAAPQAPAKKPSRAQWYAEQAAEGMAAPRALEAAPKPPTLMEEIEREAHPELHRFLDANETKGREVKPSTPEQVFAAEFLKQRGAKLVLVEGDTKLKLPGMYSKGAVMLDARRGGELKALAFHEITHRLAAEIPDSYQGLFLELAKADPEGVRGLGREYMRRLRKTGRAQLSPEEVAEEATAFYAESIPGYLEAAFRDPKKLASLAQANPGLLRRIADAVVKALQKIRAGFGLKTSQQKALIALRAQLARTNFEKGLDPALAASVAQKIAKAVNALQAQGESATSEAAPAAEADPYADEERRAIRSEAEPSIEQVEAVESAEQVEPALQESLADPEIQGKLADLAETAGWAETGGRLIMGEGGAVIGRTKWAPKAEWWPARPVKRNEAWYKALVAKVAADPGAKLGSAERKALEWMVREEAPRFAADDTGPPKKPRLVGYEWRSETGDKFSAHDGGMISGRVSDWSRAETGGISGRQIVHVFMIDDGSGPKPYGRRIAAQLLGIPERSVQSKANEIRAAAEKAKRDQASNDSEFAARAKFDSVGEANRAWRLKNRSVSGPASDAQFQMTAVYSKGGKYLTTVEGGNIAKAAERDGWALERSNGKGEAEKRDSGPMFAVARDDLGFFSQLEHVIDTKLPNKASPKQVLDIARGGAKAEELEWSGLEEFLKGKESVTKAEVLDFLRESNVKVEEVVHGARIPGNGGNIERLQNGRYLLTTMGGTRDSFDTLEEAEAERARIADITGTETTKFGRYQLPGGENYREVLLTLGDRGAESANIERIGAEHVEANKAERDIRSQARAPVFAEFRARIEELQAKAADFGLDPEARESWRMRRNEQERLRDIAAMEAEEAALRARPEVRERAFQAREALQAAEDARHRGRFRSGHFDEPNVLAHVRMNERTDSEGKRTLFLEEVQSDWHQKGRREGYRQGPEVTAPLDAEYRRLVHKNADARDAGREPDPADVQRAKDLEAQLHTMDFSKIPDAPFKSTWHELALKRMVRWAAEKGFDAVAWTTGEQQAARYHKALTDAADTITVEPWHGGYHVGAFKEGREVLGGKIGSEAKELPDHIGKEMADEAVRRIEAGEKLVTFTSENGFKVGGHGLRGFYDKILVVSANKLGKKFGAKVGTADVRVQGQGPLADPMPPDIRQRLRSMDFLGFDTAGLAGGAILGHDDWISRFDIDPEHVEAIAQWRDRNLQRAAVHSLPITQSMRASALSEGFPRFAVAKSEGEEGFDLPDESKMRRFYTGMVDDLERLKQAEKLAPSKVNGEQLTESLQLHPGRRFGEREKLERRMIAPLKKRLAASGIPPIVSTAELPSASDFLYALHAPTRNAVMAERHPRKFGTESSPGSGMTNSEAAAIVEKALTGPQAETYRFLQTWNQRLARARLATLKRAGLISGDERAAWAEQFGEDYVPLKTATDPAKDYIAGSGFGVSGKESKRAEGRKSRADSPLIFALQASEQAIERAQRNAIGQKLAALVRANPAGPWRVETDANKIKEQEFGLRFKEDGEQRWIVTDDKPLYEAFKRIQDPKPGVLSALDPVNKWLRRVIISWNPVFPLTNVPRDIGTAAVKSAIQGNFGATLGAMKNALPAARGALHAIRSEDASGRWEDVYRRARDAGALIGWTQGQSFEERAKDFEAALSPRSKAAAFGQFLEDLNKATELGTRLAVFDALIKAGKTKQQAAIGARRVTADFARKGRWAPVYSRLFLFSGANVQGTSEMVEAIAKNPRRAALVLGTLIGAGFGMAMLSFMHGDDDELDKLTEEDKARFFGVMVGKRRYGVAAPYGFNVFPYIGWKMAEVLLKDADKGKAAAGVTAAMLDSMSPLPRGANLGQSLTPTVARPFEEIRENLDFAGRPIAPAENPFERSPPPNVDRFFQGVSPVSKAVAKGAFEASGEQVDVSPEWIDHMAKAATGGLGTWAGRTVESVRKAITGETDWSRLTEFPVLGPAVRPFVQEASRGAEARIFYDALSAIEEARDRKKTGRELSPEQEAAIEFGEALIPDPTAKPIKQKGAPKDAPLVQPLKKRTTVIENETSALRKALKAATDAKERSRLESELRALQDKFNREFQSARRPLAGKGNPNQ